jgi:mannose-6-phosphate isomerase class I
MPASDQQEKIVIDAAISGKPLYLQPYKEPKVWGVGGIGEYWYGGEKEPKSSIARVGKDTAPMADVIKEAANEVLGKDVVEKFGEKIPLVKGRLSVQFHDAKNELWIVTGIDNSVAGREAWIILGFNSAAVEKHGEKIKERYKEALENYAAKLNALIDVLENKGYRDLLKNTENVVAAAEGMRQEESHVARALDELNSAEYELKRFYNYRSVNIGDVIPVPARTLHALGPGVEVVEPQIPGPTQSMEDGATYPVRYYFPGYEREGSKKELDVARADEINAGVVKRPHPKS